MRTASCAGAVLMNMETKELIVARAKTVIHRDRRCRTDCIIRASRPRTTTARRRTVWCSAIASGAKLLYADTLQYHPTGAAFPQQIYGALVTEKVRSLGAMLVNRDGEVFMHPLETRDVAAASIIRECSDRNRGRPTPAAATQCGWIRR